MRVIPYLAITLQTPADIAVVRERLRARVVAEGNSGGKALFRGDVWDSGFRLTPIIGYKNGFIPALRGSFAERMDGTRIEIGIGLTVRSVTFLSVWSALLIPVLVISFLRASSDELPWHWVFLPFGMLLFGWLLAIGGFWLEASSSREKLEQVLLRENGK
jgi:hypothetical protein